MTGVGCQVRNSYLIKSLSEIGNAGRLAYIMPLEFLNTGYGKLVKARLIEGGHLAAIISLDCERDVFLDVALTDVDVKDALRWVSRTGEAPERINAFFARLAQGSAADSRYNSPAQ